MKRTLLLAIAVVVLSGAWANAAGAMVQFLTENRWVNAIAELDDRDDQYLSAIGPVTALTNSQMQVIATDAQGNFPQEGALVRADAEQNLYYHTGLGSPYDQMLMVEGWVLVEAQHGPVPVPGQADPFVHATSFLNMEFEVLNQAMTGDMVHSGLMNPTTFEVRDLVSGNIVLTSMGAYSLAPSRYAITASWSLEETSWTGQASARSYELQIWTDSPFSATTPIPEPATLVLLGGGLAMGALRRRRRR